MINDKIKIVFKTFSLIVFLFISSTNVTFGSELDKLFLKLKKASNQNVALKYEGEIWRYWYNDGFNDNSNKIMDECLVFFKNNKLDKAINCFTDLNKLDHNWAEPLNKIATIKFLMGDYEKSIRYIKLTLKKEPRHFGAIAGLVQINVILKKYDTALKHLASLEKIHPFISILSLRPGLEKLLKKTSDMISLRLDIFSKT